MTYAERLAWHRAKMDREQELLRAENVRLNKIMTKFAHELLEEMRR